MHCAAALKSFRATLDEYLSQAKSVFSSRTEESSAVQYFQVGVLLHAELPVAC